MTQFVPEGEANGEGVDETLPPEAEPAQNMTTEQVAEEQEAATQPADVDPEAAPEETTDWEAVAAERTTDLQRLQAEYVNYKRRVDRDRTQARQAGMEAVLQDLMPVLDSITLAREHGDYEGGVKLIADELEKVALKHDLVMFGAVGEPFDPNLHDALMSVPMEEPVEVTTISQVMQQGYKLKGRVIRPARVGVANPG